MKLEERSKDDLIFGHKIWWERTPPKAGLIEIKMSSDNRNFFFIRKEATYVLTLEELTREVEKQIKKQSKKKD